MSYFLQNDILNTNIPTAVFQKGGFFRGLAFPLVSYGVVNSVYFGVYGNVLKWIHNDPTTQPGYKDVFVAGCIGGAVQLIPACPIDVVKVVLQSQISRTAGKFSVLVN